MTKPEAGEGRDKTANSEKAGATSAKVASESVTSEPQAQKYEPRFTSFSSQRDDISLDADSPLQQLMNRIQRTGPESSHGVSEFSIEDKDLGKIITARGERSNAEPRQSFMDGLKRLSQSSELSPEQREREQAQFSIDYIMKKASEFFQDTADGIRDGLQAIMPQTQSDSVTSSTAHTETDPVTGQAMVQVGRRFYPADSVTADSGQIASDATPTPASRTWEKVTNPPVAWEMSLRKAFGDKTAKEYIDA